MLKTRSTSLLLLTALASTVLMTFSCHGHGDRRHHEAREEADEEDEENENEAKEEHKGKEQQEAKEADEEDDEGVESKITFAELPAPVVESYRKFASDKEAGAVEKQVRKHGTAYEITFVHDGHKGAAVIAEHGDVMELENSVEPAKLPKAISDALARAMPGAKVEGAELVTEHYYECVVSVGGKKQAVKVRGDGWAKLTEGD
jgi:hypothetical protein